MRNKKYTGIEGIRFKVFFACTKFIENIITNICKMSFYTGSIPNCCQTTLGMMIPKNKPNEFRIVHISTALSSLLEEIALHRLEYLLEKYLLYSARQYAFMIHKSRHDLVARILELTIKHRQLTGKQARTTVINLDIEGAFDNVNQDRLTEKIMDELRNDPLKYWLRNFILSRHITVRHNNLESSRKAVCTGVPQGSSLGPILWNFMINDIDKGLILPDQLELLCYADDLILVYNGTDKSILQRSLDMVNESLKKLSLRVNARKSKTIVFYNGKRGYATHKYSIDGANIEVVKSMSILGIPITQSLRLDQNHAKTILALNRNISKLYKLNQLRIVHGSLSWKKLIESYITSITTINNLPMLAIDRSAREWCDKLNVKSIRMIFAWPSNSSEKLAKLFTGTTNAETTIRHLISNRMTQPEHTEVYSFLMAHMNNTSQSNTLYKDTIPNYRQFHNPQLTFPSKPKLIPIQKLINTIFWFPIESNDFTHMVEVLYDLPIQILTGRHYQYPIGYFNTMATLWSLADQKLATNHTVLMYQRDSLAMALQNNLNHDWRIIQLRETLIKQNCSLTLISNQTNQHLKNQLRNYCIQNTDEMLIYEPDLSDYEWRHSLTMIHKNEIQRETEDRHTTITKTICPYIDAWKQISPTRINSVNMLTLTGTFNTPNDKLAFGILNEGEIPTGCTSGQCRVMKHSHRHILLHRMFECSRFKDERCAIKELMGDSGGMKQIIQNRDKRNKLFGIMATLALNK